MIPISRNVQQSTDDVHLVMYFMSLYIDFTLDVLWQRKYFVVLKANSDFPSISASNFDLSTFPFDRQADNQTDLKKNKHTNQINRQTWVVRSAARSAVGRAVVLKSSSKSSGHSCPENPISYSFWKQPDKPARLSLSLSVCQAQQKWKQILRRKCCLPKGRVQ